MALIGQYSASFGQTYLTQLVGQRAMNDLRLRLHQHVLSLASSFFDRTPLGRLMTRITSDVEALNEMFASGLVSLVGDVIRLTAILIAIFGIDWKLALFSMGSAPVLFAIAAVFRRFVRDAFRDIRTKLARLNAFLQEHISGMKVVQAFAREERVAGALRRDQPRLPPGQLPRDRRRRRALLGHRGAGVDRDRRPGLARRRAHRRRHADLRRAGGVHRVPDQVLRPDPRSVGEVHDHAAGDGGGRAGLRLLDTHEPDAPVRAGGCRDRRCRPSPEPATPLIEIDDVTFGYRAGQPVLNQVSLPIWAGETVAVVGSTGSGKSTLIKLLPRLYEPWSGAIRLGGVDVRDLDRRALRRRIVVVSQDVFLFAGTLGDNIGLDDPDLSREAILEAARRVGADRVIARRPEGLDAPVIERGANFSAGERQLISFARALCRDPEILILDEATASVDPETERLIERGTEELMRGRTSIVIAHRLSTIRRATRIITVHQGRIAEEGSHDELLARDGIYARALPVADASPDAPEIRIAATARKG